jgi:diaminopimelate decarboxylase
LRHRRYGLRAEGATHIATAGNGCIGRIGSLAMSLPGSPFLARQAGRLMLEGVDLESLARRFGTPLYVYSQQAMLSVRSLAAGTWCAMR